MKPRPFWTVAAPLLVAMTAVTRWPFRSAHLFSWDSANFAFAVDRIDVAAHRPHPPGYLGYVFAARTLNSVTNDVNGALVLWNVVATALVLLLVARMAAHMAAEEPSPRTFVVAAIALTVTSPLLWFYGEVAEIYTSELLVSFAVAFGAWRAVRGSPRGLYWVAAGLPLAAVFKLSAAVFTLPLAAYAFLGAPPRTRVRASVGLVICSAAAAVVFLVTVPEFVSMLRHQLTANVSDSQVFVGRDADPIERINRNLRDTSLAAVAGIGAFNLAALLWLLVRDRRMPNAFSIPTALLWTAPWLMLCIFVHIAKPGYLLPVLPPIVLVLAAFYARRGPRIGGLLIAAQALANIACFLMLQPFPDELTGGRRPYRTKTLAQRLFSDAQPLTAITRHTIRDSDAAVSRLLRAVDLTCAARDPVVITGMEPVDGRRVSYYLPQATVVQMDGRAVRHVARSAAITPLSGPMDVSGCAVFWLTRDDRPPDFSVPADATRVPGVGFVRAGGSVQLAPTSMTVK